MNTHRTATLPTDRDLGMSKTIPFFSNVIDLILQKETQRELKKLYLQCPLINKREETVVFGYYIGNLRSTIQGQYNYRERAIFRI